MEPVLNHSAPSIEFTPDADFSNPEIKAADIQKKFLRWTTDYPCLNPFNRAPQMRLNEDGDLLSAQSVGPYCSVFGTHGVNGSSRPSSHPHIDLSNDPTGLAWYYEVVLVNDEGCVRVGWAEEDDEIHSYCGFTTKGYGIRSDKATVFHNSRGYFYGKNQSFKKGDIIGCSIRYSNVARKSFITQDAIFWRDSPELIVSNIRLQTEIATYQTEISFFKNGEFLGIAFADIGQKHDKKMFPMISLFRGAEVRVNFENFHYFPDTPILNVFSLASIQGFVFVPLIERLSKRIKQIQKTKEEKEEFH
ncbi:hypothetical protein PCE1_001288 [Barthelona sp. PCE]